MGRFADSLENDVGHAGVSADAGGIPNTFALFFCGVTPGGLAVLKPLPYNALGFTQQHRNIFTSMQAIAGEERDDDEVLRLCKVIALSDAGLFFHENRMDGSIKILFAEKVGLVLDGNAGIVVLFGAVTGDKERNVLKLRRAGKREFFDDFAGASEQNRGEAIVCANGLAVELFLRAISPDAGEFALTFTEETKRVWNDVLAEIAFADKEGDDEDAGGGDRGKDLLDGGFLFPKGFVYFRKDVSSAQFGGVLADWSGGLGVKSRAMSDQHQRGVREAILDHEEWLTQSRPGRKARR